MSWPLSTPWLALVLGATVPPGHDQHRHSAEFDAGVHIVVTINPEARVSAQVVKRPLPQACEGPTELKIKVFNEGFVTAPLRVAVIGSGGPRVSLNVPSQPLSGGPTDVRTIRVVHHSPELTDVTLAFSITDERGDLGGRDRVYLLLGCATPGTN